MIGTYCLSIDNLKKNLANGSSCKLLVVNNRSPYHAEMYKCKNGELAMFSPLYTNIKDFKCFGEDAHFANTKYQKYGGVMMFTTDSRTQQWINMNLTTSTIIKLPGNFDEKYEMFIKNNNKSFNQLLDKYELDKDNAILQYIYCLCGDSINFFSWAIKNMYGKQIPLSTISYVMSWNDKYSQQANKLVRGTITAYNGLENILGLITELCAIRKAKRANDCVMKFNTQQKKILKERVGEEKIKNILSKFGTLSDTKQQNFIRKMSTIDDSEEIIKQMSYLCDVHFEWNKKSLLEYLENTDNIKFEVVIDKDNILLVKTYDYETIKRLAKTTNWCISKNKSYWNNYLEGGKKDCSQFVLFDFNKDEDDELSIVGFTAHPKRGITHAHSFTNNNIMGESDLNNNLETFEPVKISNIHQILNSHNIPLMLFYKSVGLSCEWSKESVIAFLKNNIKERYNILLNKDDKLVFATDKCMNATLFFDPQCFEYFDSYNFDSKCIYFCDFGKDCPLGENFFFNVVNVDENGMEFCYSSYNASLRKTNVRFDDLLEKYGLPYNVIKRIDKPFTRLEAAIESCDLNAVRELLKKHDCIKDLKKNKDRNSFIYDRIYHSIFNKKSKSLIDVFYDNNIRLVEIISFDNLKHIARQLYTEITSRLNILGHLPTEEDYNLVFSHQIHNRNKAVCVGYFKILEDMMIHEPIKAFSSIGERLYDGAYSNTLITYFLTVMDEKAKAEGKVIPGKWIEVAASVAYGQRDTQLMEKLKTFSCEKRSMDVVRDYEKAMHGKTQDLCGSPVSSVFTTFA